MVNRAFVVCLSVCVHQLNISSGHCGDTAYLIRMCLEENKGLLLRATEYTFRRKSNPGAISRGPRRMPWPGSACASAQEVWRSVSAINILQRSHEAAEPAFFSP